MGSEFRLCMDPAPPPPEARTELAAVLSKENCEKDSSTSGMFDISDPPAAPEASGRSGSWSGGVSSTDSPVNSVSK